MAVTATRTLSITVTEILYLKLVEMARKQNYTPTVYSRLLLEAAYSARVATSGDKTLDAAVASIGRVQPTCTEGEAMIATATKHSEREITALKDELAQAAVEIERLRKLAKDGENFREQMEQNSALLNRVNRAEEQLKERADELAHAITKIADLNQAAKGQLVLVNGAKVAIAERDDARKTIAEHEATIDHLTRLLAAHDAPPVARPVAPEAAPAPAQPIAEEPSSETKPDIDVSYHLSVADRRKVRAWQAYGMSLAECAKSLNLPQAWLAEAMRRT